MLRFMKKNLSPRLFFFVGALLLSLAACTYLNHPSRLSLHLNTALDGEVSRFESYEETPSRKNPLPDTQLLRKLLEAGKRLIPVN